MGPNPTTSTALPENRRGPAPRRRRRPGELKVAVKVLPEDFSADPDRLRRFEQEADSSRAALHHVQPDNIAGARALTPGE